MPRLDYPRMGRTSSVQDHEVTDASEEDTTKHGSEWEELMKKNTSIDKDNLEKHFSTNFGSIRMDRSNQPEFHGQHDFYLKQHNQLAPDEGSVPFKKPPEKDKPLFQYKPDRDPKTSSPVKDWYIEEASPHQFQPQAYHGAFSHQLSQSSPVRSSNFSFRPAPSGSRPQISLDGPEDVTLAPNFVDSQYFEVKDHVSDESPVKSNDDAKPIEDLNEVDTQYFGGARHVDAKVATDVEEFKR